MGEKPWVAPTALFLPPLRGSNVNIVFTVGYVRVAHFTHGWRPSAATRLCSALRALWWGKVAYRQLRSRCSLAGGYDCVTLRADVTTASSPLMACDSVSPSGTVTTMRNYNV